MMQGSGNGNGLGIAGVPAGQPVPLIGQKQVQIETGPIDQDLQSLFKSGQVPMALWIQTIREVRKLSDKIDKMESRIDSDE